MSRSTAHWRIHFIRLNGWLGHSFAQSITLLDSDGICQNWEDSNRSGDTTCTMDDRRESGAHAIFMYWHRDPQYLSCLRRLPVQGKRACTRPYSTPFHTAKFPGQYRNDIRILDRGAPLHAPKIGLHSAQNAPGFHYTARTLLRHCVRGGFSSAGWGHVELAGNPTIKKRNAAPTNGDPSRFPCGLS